MSNSWRTGHQTTQHLHACNSMVECIWGQHTDQPKTTGGSQTRARHEIALLLLEQLDSTPPDFGRLRLEAPQLPLVCLGTTVACNTQYMPTVRLQHRGIRKALLLDASMEQSINEFSGHPLWLGRGKGRRRPEPSHSMLNSPSRAASYSTLLYTGQPVDHFFGISLPFLS